MTHFITTIAKAVTAFIVTYLVTEIGLDQETAESLVSSAIVALFAYIIPNNDDDKIEDAVNDVLRDLDEREQRDRIAARGRRNEDVRRLH